MMEEDLLSALIDKAKSSGADSADALFVEGISLSASCRMGKIENLQRSEGSEIGLRVFIGQCQAIVSSSDWHPEAINEMVERAIAMAREVPADEFCGLAEPGELANQLPYLDLFDSFEPESDHLVSMAIRAEESAMSVSGISNSEGAEAGWGQKRMVMVASNGFSNSYRSGGSHLSVSVVAGNVSDGMERDYDFTSAIHAVDLLSPELVGRRAGERTVRRLGARKGRSAKLPIVYDPRVSRGILGHFAGAINGSAIVRGTSFLKDCMGQQIFPKGVNVIDDPHRLRGLRSRPYDAEGIAGGYLPVVEDGILKSWITDLRSSRQLGGRSTGHAVRGVSSPPSPSVTNFWFEPGKISPDAIIGEIKDGFYVTEISGMGVNSVTGDYSRGAAGFWIEKGQISYPVNEVTIAGNLRDMFQNIILADDVEFRYGIDAPTIMIDGMTISGS